MGWFLIFVATFAVWVVVTVFPIVVYHWRYVVFCHSWKVLGSLLRACRFWSSLFSVPLHHITGITFACDGPEVNPEEELEQPHILGTTRREVAGISWR